MSKRGLVAIVMQCFCTKRGCEEGHFPAPFEPMVADSSPAQPTLTESLFHSDGCTIWPLILVGSRGPSSPNEHGQKSEANKRERSLPKNKEQ